MVPLGLKSFTAHQAKVYLHASAQGSMSALQTHNLLPTFQSVIGLIFKSSCDQCVFFKCLKSVLQTRLCSYYLSYYTCSISYSVFFVLRLLPFWLVLQLGSGHYFNPHQFTSLHAFTNSICFILWISNSTSFWVSGDLQCLDFLTVCLWFYASPLCCTMVSFNAGAI